MFDLIRIDPDSGRWDFDLLKVGRHFRFDGQTKVVLGRDQRENDKLRYMHELAEARSTALLTPVNFAGPEALLIGPPTSEAIEFTGGLVLRYSKRYDAADARLKVDRRDEAFMISAATTQCADSAPTLTAAT